MKTHLLLLVFAGGFSFCAASDSVRSETSSLTWIDPAEPGVSTIREAGEAGINLIGRQMVYEIQSTIAKEGLVKAVALVHLKNHPLPELPPGQPRLTALKLTSAKLRNPANQPDAGDQAALDKINSMLEYGDEIPSILLQKVERTGQPTEWRAYRPLAMLPLCLKCHGAAESLTPEVRTALATQYPQDQAVDYRPNTLRGIIRVSLSTTTPAAP